MDLFGESDPERGGGRTGELRCVVLLLAGGTDCISLKGPVSPHSPTRWGALRRERKNNAVRGFGFYDNITPLQPSSYD